MCAAPNAKTRQRPQTVNEHLNEHVWLNSGVQDLGDWLLTRVRAAAFFASIGRPSDPFFAVHLASRRAPANITPAEARAHNDLVVSDLRNNYYASTSHGKRTLLDGDEAAATILRVQDLGTAEVAEIINRSMRSARTTRTRGQASSS